MPDSLLGEVVRRFNAAGIEEQKIVLLTEAASESFRQRSSIAIIRRATHFLQFFERLRTNFGQISFADRQAEDLSEAITNGCTSFY